MKIQEIQDLIKLVSRTGVTEVEIEQKDFKLSIKSESKKKNKLDLPGVSPDLVAEWIKANSNS